MNQMRTNTSKWRNYRKSNDRKMCFLLLVGQSDLKEILTQNQGQSTGTIER